MNQRFAFAVVVSMVCTGCDPHTERVRLSSGKKFDVISLAETNQAVGDSASTNVSPVVVLNYYAVERTPVRRLAEADELLEVAIPVAERQGDAVIVIQQTYPLTTRLPGVVSGYMTRYRRDSTGSWRR